MADNLEAPDRNDSGEFTCADCGTLVVLVGPWPGRQRARCLECEVLARLPDEERAEAEQTMGRGKGGR